MTSGGGERAELICDRSSELAAFVGAGDVANVAIDLLRAADHDETVLTHALGIGRSRVRRESANESDRRGVQLLERVVAFLGVKPRADEIGRRGGAAMTTAVEGSFRNGLEDLRHQPGTCHPPCSPKCYQAKIRSLAFTLPVSFRATR